MHGSESRSVVFDSLRPHGLYSPWHSPGQKTGVGSLSFLHEIVPTQGSNQDLLHCRQILYQLSYPWGTYKCWCSGWLSVLQGYKRFELALGKYQQSGGVWIITVISQAAEVLLAPIPTAKITYPNEDDCLDKNVTLTLPTHTSKKVNEVLGQDMKRERMQKRRENSQGRQNNNSLSIKQNQGWLFPP